jgi:H+-translocating NAD(P) transhydrogenase subunit beta
MAIPQSLLTTAYLGAAILFILSLGGLSTQASARRGNFYGMVGMVIAIAATALHPSIRAWGLMGGGVVVGGAIGAVLAARVAMTAMPELVAILHSFVGLAAVLVGMASHLEPHEKLHGGELVAHSVEVWLGVAIGALTFTGSVVAWAKLRGSLSGRPLLLPGRHLLNLIVVLSIIGLAVPFVLWTINPGAGPIGTFQLLLGMSVVAGLLGVHLVMAIGGADMPVVVSLLNSYSGWAAAAAGFMLANDLLIVTGALVGSSGAILSIIMCKAMNRSIANVVFGGFGADSGAAPAPSAQQPAGELVSISHADVAAAALSAREVMIVPGYGMAVGRAQHLVHDFTRTLRSKGINVRFAIHPVAGRLPGHMNVLLAEAGVPYDIVLEMDEINGDCPRTDLVLVIGANDIVNPGAETDASSPIYGMPVIQVWKSKMVVVLKRGKGAGYAGIENPLFFNENSRMLYGDARDSMDKLVAAIKGG